MSAPVAPTFAPGPDAGQAYASFTAPLTVTITGTGNVFYSLDGRDPTTHGVLYTAPIVLNVSTTVKAVAVNTNLIGPVATQDFIQRG